MIFIVRIKISHSYGFYFDWCMSELTPSRRNPFNRRQIRHQRCSISFTNNPRSNRIAIGQWYSR
ncbi:hypothetical protein HanOQP8_Chr11g0416761 [Helianthus annuus]|nr:hypothetical protein HanHA89_Chr11g0438061 [Helianthus annuus]KAJ0686525.1 hypothetical protein HanLR1_Chr11g0415751 [Helianthus annuus]KAJ0690340.1 hypothetical protein HanOQP8_Chr11g0416761 [Helianthus annuus]